MLFWGDLAVSAALQFSMPSTTLIFDVDGTKAREIRLKGFERAESERLLCAGTHLPFPAFGYVARQGNAYQWVPEEWRYDLKG